MANSHDSERLRGFTDRQHIHIIFNITTLLTAILELLLGLKMVIKVEFVLKESHFIFICSFDCPLIVKKNVKYLKNIVIAFFFAAILPALVQSIYIYLVLC